MYKRQVVYILFMQCMVFVCVIWSFDEMGLREQVILPDKGNRETEQIINIGKVIIFWKRDGRYRNRYSIYSLFTCAYRAFGTGIFFPVDVYKRQYLSIYHIHSLKFS